MSRLIWPRSNTTLSETPDPEAFDMLPAYTFHERLKYPNLVAILRETIQQNSLLTRQVIRAGLIQVPDPETDAAPSDELIVVCKVAHGRRQIARLKEEADIYNEDLRDLQGAIVPLVIGCYVGKTGEGWHVGVLILEDCGNRLEWNLPSYSQSLRKQAVLSLLAIHRKGVVHGDFKGRNIVAKKRDDGQIEIRIIDFDRSYKAVCPFQGDESELTESYAQPPERRDFPCDELYDACWDASIWFDRRIMLSTGHSWLVETLQHPEIAVDSIMLPPGMTREDAIREISRHIIALAGALERRQAIDADPCVPE
ncbi:hypothetical protein BN946_scf184969.g88 [Trametes cinnabarina]|uniref:Protein kinase domain-containing protein n=1 Tax=Pycnoporus cinnabarinus TaxID=5643 RepID=A0A060SUC3_PYCCI|nr:hypothetical protein BN946_scf184969.g88 [Trametes cinnabarina]